LHGCDEETPIDHRLGSEKKLEKCDYLWITEDNVCSPWILEDNHSAIDSLLNIIYL
jgi:hypothetical protein